MSWSLRAYHKAWFFSDNNVDLPHSSVKMHRQHEIFLTARFSDWCRISGHVISKNWKARQSVFDLTTCTSPSWRKTALQKSPRSCTAPTVNQDYAPHTPLIVMSQHRIARTLIFPANADLHLSVLWTQNFRQSLSIPSLSHFFPSLSPRWARYQREVCFIKCQLARFNWKKFLVHETDNPDI